MKQAPRHMHPDLEAKVEMEADKLVTASFIREVQYPVWLAKLSQLKENWIDWSLH